MAANAQESEARKSETYFTDSAMYVIKASREDTQQQIAISDVTHNMILFHLFGVFLFTGVRTG